MPPAPDNRSAPRRWPSPDRLTLAVPPTQAMDRLRAASRRGRMPGFRELGPAAFTLEVFGVPWEKELRGDVSEAAGGSQVRLSRINKPLMPIVWVAVLILSVWPGVVLLDTFIPTSWGWIGRNVWTWYIPLTVVLNIWTWVWAVRKTEQTTAASAEEVVARLARELSPPAAQPS